MLRYLPLLILLAGCQNKLILKEKVKKTYRVGEQMVIRANHNTPYQVSFHHNGETTSVLKHHFQSIEPLRYRVTIQDGDELLLSRKYTIIPRRGDIYNYLPEEATLILDLSRYPDIPLFQKRPGRRDGFLLLIDQKQYHLSKISGTCQYQGFYFTPECPPENYQTRKAFQKEFDLLFKRNYYQILADQPLTVFSKGESTGNHTGDQLTFISPVPPFSPKPLLELHEEHPLYLDMLLKGLGLQLEPSNITGYRFQLLPGEMLNRRFEKVKYHAPFILELYLINQNHQTLFPYFQSAQKMMLYRDPVYYLPEKGYYIFTRGERLIITSGIQLHKLLPYIQQIPHTYTMRGALHSGYLKRHAPLPKQLSNLFDIDQLFPEKTRINYYFINYQK